MPHFSLKAPVRYTTLWVMLGATLGLLACQKTPAVDPVDLEMVHQGSLPSQARSMIGKPRFIQDHEPDAVPEAVAQDLLKQLSTWTPDGPQWAETLKTCAALHAFEVNAKAKTCTQDFNGEPDLDCLLNKGHGQKAVGQMLMADRFDLNSDGVNDYLISDRYYCNELSANQSTVFFVLLSGADKRFRLAYADWASYGLEVFRHPRTQQLVLVESAGKTYGAYSRILQLNPQQRYVERTCIFEDDHGASICTKPQ